MWRLKTRVTQQLYLYISRSWVPVTYLQPKPTTFCIKYHIENRKSKICTNSPHQTLPAFPTFWLYPTNQAIRPTRPASSAYSFVRSFVRSSNFFTLAKLGRQATQPSQPAQPDLFKDNSSLDSTLVPHTLQTLTPLLEFESLIDDSVDFDFAWIEVVDCGRCWGLLVDMFS